MRRTASAWQALFIALLAYPSLPSWPSPTPPSIEQLAAFPRMSSFSIAPDGKHLAAIEARGEDRVILVWKTDALNQPPTVIGSSRMKLRSVQFIKNDLLAVTMWQPYDSRLDTITKTFITKLFITDLAGKNWQEPLPQERSMSRIGESVAALASPAVLDPLHPHGSRARASRTTSESGLSSIRTRSSASGRRRPSTD